MFNNTATDIYVGYKVKLNSTEKLEQIQLQDIHRRIVRGEFKDIVEAIRSAENDSKIDVLKKKLGIFYPCLKLDYAKFSSNETVKATGLIQFDIDRYDNIDESKKLRDKIATLHCTYYAFLSPSGGVKFAFLSDFQCEDKSIIKDAYKNAFKLAKKYLENQGINIEIDDSTERISQGCYMSFDEGAYLNKSADKFVVSDEALDLARKEKKERDEIGKNRNINRIFSEADDIKVLDALSYIPDNLKYDKRREVNERAGRFEINKAVISHFGDRAVGVLLTHWSKQDKDVLRKQISDQIKDSRNKFTVGTLFYEAKKYGWIEPVTSGVHAETKKTEFKGSYQSERLNLTAANQKLSDLIKDYFQNKTNRIILYEAGAGKTARMIEEVVKYNKGKPGKKIAIFVKSYDFAEEIEQKLNDALGSKKVENPKETFLLTHKVHKIQGMDRLCSRPVEIIKTMGTALCKSCEYGFASGAPQDPSCAYITQYDKPLYNRIRIYTHNHLFNPSRYDDGFDPDYVIIDEDILQLVTDVNSNTISYMRDELDEPYKCVFDDIKENKPVLVKRIIIDSLRAEMHKIDGQLGNAGSEDEKLITKSKERKKIQRLLNFLELASQEFSKKFISRTYDNRLGKEVEKVFIGIRGEIDEKWKAAPILYLDASADNDAIKEYFGDDFEVDKIRVKYNENVTVQQVVNCSFSKKFIDNSDIIWSKLELFLKELRGKTVVVTHKKYREKLNSLGIADEDILHFGNLRGIDRFSDYDNIVVLGKYQMPSDAIIEKSILFFNHVKSKEEFVCNKESKNRYMDYRQQVIEMKSGNNLIVDNLKYIDNRLRILSEHIEGSELYQAIHRLRLIHGNKKKNVYILTNTVTDVAVDSVIKSEDLLGGRVQTTNKKKLIIEVVNSARFLQYKNKILVDATGIEKRALGDFKRKNDGWFKKTFKIVTVEARTKSKHVKNIDYLVSADFAKATDYEKILSEEILKDEKILSVTVVK